MPDLKGDKLFVYLGSAHPKPGVGSRDLVTAFEGCRAPVEIRRS